MFSFRNFPTRAHPVVEVSSQNTKRASLGEQKTLREDYSLSVSAIKAMRPLPLDWVEFLEAAIPTYDTLMTDSGIDIQKLTHLRGMKEAAQILRNAYVTQNDRSR